MRTRRLRRVLSASHAGRRLSQFRAGARMRRLQASNGPADARGARRPVHVQQRGVRLLAIDQRREAQSYHKGRVLVRVRAKYFALSRYPQFAFRSQNVYQVR